MSAMVSGETSRTGAIAIGIAMAIGGVIVLAWPGITTLVLVTWLGLAIALYGVTELSAAIAGSTEGSRLWAGFVGVISLLGGLSIFLTPVVSSFTIALVIGWYWVIGGVAGLLGAVFHAGHRIVRALVAVLSLLAGVIVLAQPGISLVTLTWFTGAWMLASGLVVAGVSIFGRRSAPA